jgi:DNA mismatch repair protein MutS
VLPRVKNYHMAAVEQDGRVVFLHELRPGGADRSYGIHVAELAGIPRPVIRRAGELLAQLENQEPRTENREPRTGKRKGVSHTPDPSTGDEQLPKDHPSLFDLAPSPVIEMLRRLNVNELSPIEALTKLYELQKLANQ